MKIKSVGITILVILFSFICFWGLSSYYERPIFAEVSCPSHMDPNSEQCLRFLQEQLSEIQRKQTTVERKLKEEEYQQLSLQDRIAYINNQIASTENSIKRLEVQIAAHNIEINLLQKDIKDKENAISVLGQEISILEDSVVKRISESYKYSFIGPLELFLDLRNFNSILRRTKYLAITRTQDREYLGVYSSKMTEIQDEERELAAKRSDLQRKRNTIDEERIQLAQYREDLGGQRTERERLLAESRANEAALAAELNQLMELSNEVAAIVTRIIMNRYQTGLIPIASEVEAGDIIGFQGHTGFSYGSHLHFNLSGAGTGPLELGYFTISGGRVYGNKALSPLGDGAWLTQGYHAGYSLDMVGLSNWNSQTYSVGRGEVCCPSYIINPNNSLCDSHVSDRCCVRPGNYNLNGEGTPVRAIKSGVVTTVQTDPCGGKYVIVDHGGGERSLYLHLR